jgi:outer membrane protein
MSLDAPPDSLNELVDEAYNNRPEIMAQNYEYRTAQHFRRAEWDLLLPNIQALGVVGRVPFAQTVNGVQPFTRWYGAAGVDINIPILNGFPYPSRSKQAALRTQAARTIA